jgi:mono/diheme cytochrome c family protein
MNLSGFKILVVLAVFLSALSNAAAQDSQQIAYGSKLYVEHCQLCHGEDGKRGVGFQTPIWGEGSLIATKFGNAQALIDYMLLMPFNDPTSLNDTQKLAVVAYLLANHGAIPRHSEVAPQDARGIAIK